MKDAFSFPMPAGNNTEIDPIPQEAACSKGCFLSSNGYYGYQPVLTDNKCHQQGQETVFESMEVNNSDDGIQFNNYIDPEDRVKQRQDNITMGNRQGGFLRSNKRHYDYGDSAQPLKKRREHEPQWQLQQAPPAAKHVNMRHPTHNLPDMPRCLMWNF